MHRNRTSNAFATQEELRHGGGVGSLFFTVFIDGMIKKCTANVKKLHMGSKYLRKVDILDGFANFLL